jgi:hypothetical protein
MFLSYSIKNKNYKTILPMANKQLTLDEKQVTLDEWLIDRLREKLSKAAINASRTGKPVLLYRNIIEENEVAAEEEIATVSEKNALVQVFTYGGFIPPTFQQQYVFMLDEFPVWVMKRSRNLLLQCLENLE